MIQIKNTFVAIVLVLCLSSIANLYSQSKTEPFSTLRTGWFSMGGRSTVSLFDQDGAGLGTGGQFRVQLNNRVNTNWFADYITISMPEGVRSTYYHIGWSVLYYPLANSQYPKVVQPYILAGHCFDYNEKTVMHTPSTSKSRWGSAVQAGLGTHFNLTEKFDVSLATQYMIHLTKGLEVEAHESGEIHIHEDSHSSLEGHLLTTLSFNYKVFRLWKKQ